MGAPNKKTTPPANNGKTLVFVVDDEPMLLELAQVVLEPLGFKIRTFRDPETAIRAYQHADPRPDLIITDYAMHHLNGLDLIKACREVNPRQKVILVSGTVDASVYRNSAVKPDRFLAKPYQARQLTDLVNAVLAQ
jgi:DNA-binding NtrC family response regulator